MERLKKLRCQQTGTDAIFALEQFRSLAATRVDTVTSLLGGKNATAFKNKRRQLRDV
jgi:hypothetical protein